MPPMFRTTSSDWDFVRRVLIVFALAALVYTVWRLGDILLLVFGAALFALVLRALTNPLVRATGLKEPVALSVVVLAIAALIAAVLIPIWPILTEQTLYVVEQLPVTLKAMTARLRATPLGDALEGSTLGDLIAHLAAWGTSLVTAITGLVLVIVGGIYFAAAPHAYTEGLSKLIPEPWQAPLEAAIGDAQFALSRWLEAQGIAMLLVGLMTGFGMWAIGVPAPLALGLISGLAEFIPIIGPILGILPAMMLASSQSYDLALYAAGISLLVQQIEGNLIMPLVVGKAVEMPAAVGLFAVVALGALFGPLGLMLGYPLTVVLDAALRRLYIREALGEEVEIPAERDQSEKANA